MGETERKLRETYRGAPALALLHSLIFSAHYQDNGLMANEFTKHLYFGGGDLVIPKEGQDNTPKEKQKPFV